MSTLQPIVGQSREGDFVLRSQPLATLSGFSHVSQPWYQKTLTYDAGFEALADGQAKRNDLVAELGTLRPTAELGRFYLEHESGRKLFPDQYAVKQLGQLLKIGTQYPLALHRRSGDGDAQALAYAMRHAWRHTKDRRLWFCAQRDDTLRAVMPAEREIIPNDWYLRVIARHIPAGRLSHWRGDAETIWGNVLIPDSIRAEADSEYGAMISIANSEIGVRELTQQPSLFRAICMNGCIWGQTRGQRLVQAHVRGINLGELAERIVQNIDKQIPLAVAGLDELLATRRLTTNVGIKPVFAQVKKEYRLGRAAATAALSAWHTEARQTPQHSRSLFAIINSITRAGQAMSNDDWVRFDTLGGQLTRLGEAGWQELTDKAAKLKAKDVDGAFALAT